MSREPQVPSLELPLSRELIKPSDRCDLHEIKAARSGGVIFAVHERKHETKERDVRRGDERKRGKKSPSVRAAIIPHSQNLLLAKFWVLFRRTREFQGGERPISSYHFLFHCINANTYMHMHRPHIKYLSRKNEYILARIRDK